MTENAGAGPALDVRFAVSEAISWRDVPGEIVLFDARSQAYHALSPSGSAIWRSVAKGASVREVVSSVSALYDGAPGQIEQDVLEFLESACAKRLLSRADV